MPILKAVNSFKYNSRLQKDLPDKHSKKYNIDFRFYKASPHFAAKKKKRNKNWFPGEVLRREISEITKSVKKSLFTMYVTVIQTV